MELNLSFGLSFADLYDLKPKGNIQKVHQAFKLFLTTEDKLLAEKYRNIYETIDLCGHSELILSLGPYVEKFIGVLFNIGGAITYSQLSHEKLVPLITVKRQFVQRYALKKYPFPSYNEKIKRFVFETESDFAEKVLEWQDKSSDFTQELDDAAYYAAWAVLTSEGQQLHKEGILFKVPQKINFDNLIPDLEKENDFLRHKKPYQKERQGFSLTDQGISREQSFSESHYCIHCHHQQKDFCSKGLKPKDASKNERFEKNPLGVLLTGCPLEQKISEMNILKSQGYNIAALAVITIDNPLVAATGHRICNDCMKACIYQKQDPVNIPSTETQILKEVLDLPWGFEIYSLLTRWNPLHFEKPLPKTASGKTILVAGMGPAGFTLAHYLLNEGHTIVGIDGLKIEPLPSSLAHDEFKPIYSIHRLFENLEDRVIEGFGGVMEYGITVRWNKNFLKIIRLLLERRQRFLLKGGVRLGGTLTINQAFELGFDHVALCLGAGSPNLLELENSLAPGVRQASDFLMSLHLGGAFKKNSFANLPINLPVVVVGGGLTAVDTATEALAYYERYLIKFYDQYHQAVQEIGKENIHKNWTPEDLTQAHEILERASIIKSLSNPLEKRRLLKQWGGSTIIYRKSLIQSPSYRLNANEVEKALEEGVEIIEEASPLRITVDHRGYANGIVIQHLEKEKFISARTIFLATGIKPNTNLQYDIPNQIILTNDNHQETFQAMNEEGEKIHLEQCAKPKETHVLMRFNEKGQSVSFFGDLHPSFAGNVVKAMASAKKGYPIVSRSVLRSSHSFQDYRKFLSKMDYLLSATVQEMNRLTPTIIEIVVKAPLAAQSFQPGQFYRFQNFERIAGNPLTMEGIALAGASVDKEKGLVSVIIEEKGRSSRLCTDLKINEPIILMGPTGTPAPLPYNKTVLLIGGGVRNASLFCIGQALKQNNCKVLYVAGYRKGIDTFKTEEIEKASDQIIWCCEESEIRLKRSWDMSFMGNVVEGLTAYTKGKLGKPLISLGEIDHLFASGSDQMMYAVQKARQYQWKTFLNPYHTALGSINSLMQCMMKKICAQCLQRHINPLTGEETIVYSCVNQNQLLDEVDFKCLHGRLSQNTLQEKLSSLLLKDNNN